MIRGPVPRPSPFIPPFDNHGNQPPPPAIYGKTFTSGDCTPALAHVVGVNGYPPPRGRQELVTLGNLGTRSTDRRAANLLRSWHVTTCIRLRLAQDSTRQGPFMSTVQPATRMNVMNRHLRIWASKTSHVVGTNRTRFVGTVGTLTRRDQSSVICDLVLTSEVVLQKGCFVRTVRLNL